MKQTGKVARREFGHIYIRRGSPYWWVRYRVGGETHCESTGARDLRKAEKLLARREAELGLGAFVAPANRRMSFEDLCRLVRDDYRVNERRSLGRVEIALQRLKLTFAGVRANAMTDARLKRYAVDRAEGGVSAQTVRIELSVLRRALRLAKVAVPEMPKLARARTRTGFFDADDMAVLLDELPIHLRPVVEFAYLTGWRKGEVLGLTWDRVDFPGGVVRLEAGTTKTGEGRTFPFAALPRLKALLEERRACTRRVERRNGQIVRHVFHREGNPIRDLWTGWTSAVARAARDEQGVIVRPHLIGRVFHDLRRTAIRNLVRAGVSEHTAMKLSGHKTRSVFDRYDIVSERDLAEGVARLATFHQQAAAR